MKETPFPFTVCARTIVGFPLTVFAVSKASYNCPTSWPSHSRQCHPKDAKRAGMLSMGMMASVVPSSCTPFQSSTAQRLSTLNLTAAISASQTIPSLISPSPNTAYTRLSAWFRRRARAMPRAQGRPIPNGPVAASTPGVSSGLGCP